MTGLTINNISNLINPVLILSGYNFEILNSKFSFISCIDCTGSAIRVAYASFIKLSDSEFKNNTSTLGGAIAIFETKYDNVIFKNTLF